MLDAHGSRRAQTLAAALRLIAREGAACATTRRIAHEAGVNLGMLHYLFGSKDALLMAALESVTGAIVAVIAGSAAARRGRRATLAERCAVLYALLRQPPRASLVRLELVLALQRRPEYAEAVDVQHRRYLSALADLYDDDLGAGTSARSCQTFAQLVAGLVDGLAVQQLAAARIGAAQQPQDEALEDMLAMIERLSLMQTPTLAGVRVS